MVVCAYTSSYSGGKGMRMVDWALPRKMHETLPEKQAKAKRAELWLK
jgi:hypothetical protein